MKIINQKEFDEFNSKGFLVLKNFFGSEIMQECIDEIKWFMTQQAKWSELIPPDDIHELIKIVMRQDNEKRSFAYDHVKFIRAGRKIEYSDKVYQVMSDLGLEKPIGLESPSIRFDMKGEEQFLTKNHQDLRSIRTKKCITVWIPLTKMDVNHGTINVYPSSFEMGMVEHDLINGHIEFPKEKLLKYECIQVDANIGDLVLMNSLNVHSSYGNISDNVKINLQFFYNDYAQLYPDGKYLCLNKIPDFRDAQNQ
jgi:ectoine hydroxylase-related dioxygenase (phytanoyl-CoA dioxygenase family)